MKYLLIALLFASCMTQKKVNQWLDEHPTAAAGYCADHFPPDTTTRTVKSQADSSGYNEANDRMRGYADSLFYRLDSLQHLPATTNQLYPPRINLDSLKKEVNREIKSRLTPCVDSIEHVYHTVVDKAREKQLTGKLEEKDATITKRDTRITQLEGKVKAKNKWIWMFWILVTLNGAYVVMKAKKKIKL